MSYKVHIINKIHTKPNIGMKIVTVALAIFLTYKS